MSTRQVPKPAAGREAQRRRTRRAIVEAARALLAGGESTPTVDAIAEAADVSRRTVYVHFPTLDQLLLDAALGALSDTYVDTALATAEGPAADAGDDVHARVAALVTALLELGDTALPLGRQIIRLTVEPKTDPSDGPRRGSRRTAWIEAAVRPMCDALTDEQHERLVSALSVVIGFESMIVLRDVRGLDRKGEARANLWAARAIVDAMMSEAGIRSGEYPPTPTASHPEALETHGK